ncbi:MAG: hypothetical protein WC707_00890 [Candidatus Babeliaceae bacterium]|jgi:hypothetical protein
MKNSLLFLVCTVACTQAMEEGLTSVNNGPVRGEQDWCNFLVDVSARIKKECHARGANIATNEIGKKSMSLKVQLPSRKYMCNVSLNQGSCTTLFNSRNYLGRHRTQSHHDFKKHCSYPFCLMTFATTSDLRAHAHIHRIRLARFKSSINAI